MRSNGITKPPILLTHGDADTVIPAQAMLAAATELGHAGAGVQWHLPPGIGHGIDPAGMAMAGQFLSLAFAGRLNEVALVSVPVP